MNWELELILTWPHDRIALGWEYIGPSDNEPISTYRIFLGIFTLAFHVYHK